MTGITLIPKKQKTRALGAVLGARYGRNSQAVGCANDQSVGAKSRGAGYE